MEDWGLSIRVTVEVPGSAAIKRTLRSRQAAYLLLRRLGDSAKQ